MMQNYKSRRNFLSSLAVLTAGAALASGAEILAIGHEPSGPQKVWADFLKHYNGHKPGLMCNLPEHKIVEASKGLLHKPGDACVFDKEELVALPEWIYTETNSRKPIDLLVTFYHAGSGEKICRLNQYEINALYQRGKETGEQTLQLIAKGHLHTGKQKPALAIQTTIRPDKKAAMKLMHRGANKETTTSTYFFNV